MGLSRSSTSSRVAGHTDASVTARIYAHYLPDRDTYRNGGGTEIGPGQPRCLSEPMNCGAPEGIRAPNLLIRRHRRMA
jgi:hypothetical protein